MAWNGRVYNGRAFEATATTADGCTEMGSINLKGGLVTRGVLIDMPGTAVRRQDIEAWEAETGIKISAGDALFLRTGRDVGQQGGYHPSLIPFFKERDITLLGADAPQEGGAVEGVSIPIHFFTLVALGVHLFDNMGLEELARTARELNRWGRWGLGPNAEPCDGFGGAGRRPCSHSRLESRRQTGQTDTSRTRVVSFYS